jgi:putative NIF3 family GTP cyclohydrolase 1 type 2
MEIGKKGEKTTMVMTVQEVIDTIIAAIPGGPLKNTVDVVKAGDVSQPVTGIVTTFLATYEVIQKALAQGANLIITHEPTFYTHRDEVEWLAGNNVYEAKRRLLDEHGIVVWRFHDYWHRHQPDGIMVGVLRQLGWEAYADPMNLDLCTIPPMRLADLVLLFKQRLGIADVGVIGDPEMVCRRVGLSVGASGGQGHIRLLHRADLDVLACGELHEWETAEYVRDAVSMGLNKALVVLGHAPSEQAGMAYLVEWLAPKVPGVPITYIPCGYPLRTE